MSAYDNCIFYYTLFNALKNFIKGLSDEELRELRKAIDDNVSGSSDPTSKEVNLRNLFSLTVS